MAVRILRPDTAFALDPSTKDQRRIEDPRHLAFVRSLPSVLSGAYGCDAAHIRAGSPQHRKKRTGKGQKPDDAYVLPLTRAEHDDQHDAGDELGWWRRRGIADPIGLAVKLYEISGDKAAAIALLRRANPLTRNIQEARDDR